MNFPIGNQRSPSFSHLTSADGPASLSPSSTAGAASKPGHLPEGARASVGDGATKTRAMEGAESNRGRLSDLWNGFKKLISKFLGLFSRSGPPSQPPISAPRPQPSAPPSRSGSLSGAGAEAASSIPDSQRISYASPFDSLPSKEDFAPASGSQSGSAAEAPSSMTDSQRISHASPFDSLPSTEDSMPAPRSQSGSAAEAPSSMPDSQRVSYASPFDSLPFMEETAPGSGSQSVTSPAARLSQTALVPDAPPLTPSVPPAPPLTRSVVPQAPPLTPSTVNQQATKAQEDLFSGIRAGVKLNQATTNAPKEQSAFEKAMSNRRAQIEDDNDDDDVSNDFDFDDNAVPPASQSSVTAHAQSKPPLAPAPEPATAAVPKAVHAKPLAPPSEPVTATKPKLPDDLFSEIRQGTVLRKTDTASAVAATTPAPSNDSEANDDRGQK